MAEGKRRSEGIVHPPKPEKRKRLSDSEMSDLEKRAETETGEDVKGHIGPKRYYTSPDPLLYMPKTPNTDALVHDMETQKLIENGLADVRNMRDQMDRDKLEIERLKNETRMMIARLLTA